MRLNNKETLNCFSFIDFDVTDVSIYPISKSIIFNLSGALYKKDSQKIELGKGYFKIEHYILINNSRHASRIRSL